MYSKMIKKTALLGVCAALLLSSSSCMKIEMRSSETEFDTKNEVSETAPQMLSQATKKNEVVSAFEVSNTEAEKEEEAVEKEKITISIIGNIEISDSMITDAANRASEGQSYSFLRMYTGAYTSVSSADLSLCSYSEKDGVTSPIESIGALYDLGIDAVNVGSSSNTAEYLSEYEIAGLTENGECSVLECGELSIAALSLNGNACTGDKVKSDVEYADFVSDVVIAFVDWNETSDKDKSAAMLNLANAGADIIVGNGDKLGKIEWLDTGDGTLTLAVDSLGNIIADGSEISDVCGGMLSLSVLYGDGSIELADVCLTPTVAHYVAGESGENSGYQIFTYDSYTDEIAANHALGGVSSEKLADIVTSVVGDDFLPDYLRKN